MTYADDAIRFVNSVRCFTQEDVYKVVHVNRYSINGILLTLLALGLIRLVHKDRSALYERTKKITLG
jgi:chromosome segregation and condensation protein ScpB